MYSVLAVLALTAGCTKESSTTPVTTDPRSLFIGNWNAVESWVKLTYPARIEADSSSKMGVLIYNFAGIGFSYPPAKALISGNTITLDPNQSIGDGLVVNGSGTLTGTSPIRWNYTITSGADQWHATSVYTRN